MIPAAPHFGPAMTRRTACTLSAAFCALALSSPSPLGAMTTGRDDIHFVIRDQRLPQSVRFSTVMADKGAHILDISRGLTRIWQEDLLPLWNSGQGRIAGLTERGIWECLAEQARSHGRRSQLVAHHGITPDGSGSVTHFARAPQDIAQRAGMLETCGTEWPTVMAQLARHCPTGHQPALPLNGRIMANTAPGLVSWIIG